MRHAARVEADDAHANPPDIVATLRVPTFAMTAPGLKLPPSCPKYLPIGRVLMQIGMWIAQTMLEAFVALVMVIASLLPACCMLIMQVGLRHDRAILRGLGVVLRSPEALDHVENEIGRYREAPIYRAVSFHGMRYEFDRIAPENYRNRVGSDELFFDPGIVYVARAH